MADVLVNGRHYDAVPLAEIASPRGGRFVMENFWWVLSPESHVLFYTGPGGRFYSPQCNVKKEIVERMCPKGWTVVLVPFAYVTPRAAGWE